MGHRPAAPLDAEAAEDKRPWRRTSARRSGGGGGELLGSAVPDGVKAAEDESKPPDVAAAVG